MSGDAESSSWKVHNQRETEDGGVVCVEDGTAARHGPFLSPENGELGGGETDSNGRWRSTIEQSACPAENGTRQVMDAIASDSRETNSKMVLPSAEGEQEHKEIAGDGAGGSGTTPLAALSVVDNSRRRAEFSRHEDVAATENHSVTGTSLRSKLNGSHNWRASASPEASPASTSGESTGTVAADTGDDREEDGKDRGDEVAPAVGAGSDEAMGADDFLPLFALVLVSCAECADAFCWNGLCVR